MIGNYLEFGCLQQSNTNETIISNDNFSKVLEDNVINKVNMVQDTDLDSRQLKEPALSSKSSEDSKSKKSMVEIILLYLLQTYSFLEAEDQLYVYQEDEGYWKLLNENTNLNRYVQRIIWWSSG